MLEQGAAIIGLEREALGFHVVGEPLHHLGPDILLREDSGEPQVVRASAQRSGVPAPTARSATLAAITKRRLILNFMCFPLPFPLRSGPRLACTIDSDLGEINMHFRDRMIFYIKSEQLRIT